jgi:DNA-binding MarR family transcriptional regulator
MEIHLFNPPLARYSDPETSHKAARFAEFKASDHRIKAMTTLLQYGPMTDFELAAATGLQQNSIGKRRKDCQDAGFVDFLTDEKGEKVRRKTPSGSSAIVWQLTKAGQQYIKNLE